MSGFEAYFPTDLTEFVREMAKDMEITFEEALFLVVRDSMEKFKIFKQLTEGDFMVIDFNGQPEIMHKEEYEDYHEDTFRDVA